MNFLTLILLLFSSYSNAIESNKQLLEHSQSALKTIANDGQHAYKIKLKNGQFIAGVAIQKSADVRLDIFDPSGNHLVSFDQFEHGNEPFHFRSTRTGIYQLHVNSNTKQQGLYSIGLIYSGAIATVKKDIMQQMMVHYAADQPGGVIAVVQDGKLLFSNSYGLANLEYQNVNKTTTPYQLASASKPFTALAIAMLAEQKKLALDDDIRKHLTWMPDFGEVITVRQLLNHSSGLKDAWNLWEMSGGHHDDIVTQQQILELIKNQTELNFKPGERYQYNNGAYALLAEIISQVTNQKFSQWMAQNIFNPLEMSSTLVLDDHQLIIKQRAYSYESMYTGLKNSVVNKSYIGAVNVYSSAHDLTLWMKNLHSSKIASPQIITNMHQKSTLNDGTLKNYAYGFFILQHNGLKKIQQGGTTAGFSIRMLYYPEIDAGVIAMANTPDFNVSSIAHETAEIFFEEAMDSDEKLKIHTQIPGARAQTHADTPLQEITHNQQQIKFLDDYVGTYYSEELSTTYKLFFENKLLVLKYHRGVFPLNPKAKDRFGLNNDYYFDWDLIFERDNHDRVQSLTLDHARAQNVRFQRISIPKNSH